MILYGISASILSGHPSGHHHDHPSGRPSVHPNGHHGHFPGHLPTGSGKADTVSAVGMAFAAGKGDKSDIDAGADKAGIPMGGAADPESVHYM